MSNSAQTQSAQVFEVLENYAPMPQQTATILQHPRNGSASVDASTLDFPASMPQVAKQISSELGFTCNPSTLKTRWMPSKILPCYANLKLPQIKTENGLITEFGYSAIRDFVSACIVGVNGSKIAPETFRELLEQRFGAIPVIDPLEEINKLRATIQADKEANSQEISALAVRTDTVLARKEATGQATVELAEMLELEKLRAAKELEAQEEESEVALTNRILSKLLKERAIEKRLREELGMGK